MSKYRIVEREWSNDNKDYVVQKYSKRWYSKKYKWRPVIWKCWYGNDICCKKEPAVFPTKEDAEKYIREVTKCVVNEQVIEEYEKIHNKK